MGGSDVLEFAMERTGVGFQGFEVALGVVGLALFPASKVNAYQLVGQGATGLVVLAFVALLLLVVIALGPGFLVQTASGIFLEGLPTEFGTTVADMNPLVVAPFNHP